MMVVLPSGVIARVSQANSLEGYINPREVEFVNLTPHPLNIQLDEEGRLPILRPTFGAVEDLPEPTPGKILVVSGLTLNALKGRSDAFSPGCPIRDDQGRIVGMGALSPCPR